MSILCLITARGGSKGVPKKNIKLLNGKPLIYYTINAAFGFKQTSDVVVSTDCNEIANVAKECGANVPFIRPANLASDFAGSSEVVQHSIAALEAQGKDYTHVILLQPTSPFRRSKHIQEAFELFDDGCEMVASVKISEDSPYFNQFTSDKDGFLCEIVKRSGVNRQSVKPTFVYNGAIYIFKTASIKVKSLHSLAPVKKFLMNEFESHQIDTPLDWLVAEEIAKQTAIKN